MVSRLPKLHNQFEAAMLISRPAFATNFLEWMNSLKTMGADYRVHWSMAQFWEANQKALLQEGK